LDKPKFKVNQEIVGPRISVWPLTDPSHPTYDVPEGVDTAEYAEARDEWKNS
jgi:hypothetical protein